MRGAGRSAVAAALLGAALLLDGCVSDVPRSSYTAMTYAITPGHDDDVVIGAGRVGSDAWQMRASVDGEGELCLGVDWHPDSADDSGSNCGFGPYNAADEGRGTAPVQVSSASDAAILAYGPAPQGATQVHLTITTFAGSQQTSCSVPPRTLDLGTSHVAHSLPHWYGGRGGWFAVAVPERDAGCLLDATFQDPAGHPVASPQNF